MDEEERSKAIAYLDNEFKKILKEEEAKVRARGVPVRPIEFLFGVVPAEKQTDD